jgi:DNA-binding response OmpR family regulator
MIATASPGVRTQIPLLLVEPVTEIRELFADILTREYAVTSVASSEATFAQLLRATPAVIVTELELPDGDGVEVCRAAKMLNPSPAVVVATSVLEQVPEAIAAGCDSVLVKPVQAAVLLTRMRRLREESALVRLRAAHVRRRAQGALNKSFTLKGMLNRLWPDIECPECRHSGAVSFDFTSYRRMWCACLECKAVWAERRRE